VNPYPHFPRAPQNARIAPTKWHSGGSVNYGLLMKMKFGFSVVVNAIIRGVNTIKMSHTPNGKEAHSIKNIPSF